MMRTVNQSAVVTGGVGSRRIRSGSLAPSSLATLTSVDPTDGYWLKLPAVSDLIWLPPSVMGCCSVSGFLSLLLSCRSGSAGLLCFIRCLALLPSHFLALLVVPLTRALVLVLSSMANDVTSRSRNSQGGICAT